MLYNHFYTFNVGADRFIEDLCSIYSLGRPDSGVEQNGNLCLFFLLLCLYSMH